MVVRANDTAGRKDASHQKEIIGPKWQAHKFIRLLPAPTNADAQGTPQQMRRVIDGVREHKVPVVFSESTISDKLAKQVARETDARYGGVLYVDSLTEADGPVPTFLDLLQFNADTIVNGFLKSE